MDLFSFGSSVEALDASVVIRISLPGRARRDSCGLKLFHVDPAGVLPAPDALLFVKQLVAGG